MATQGDPRERLTSLLEGKTLHEHEGEILRAALAATRTDKGSSFAQAARLLGLSSPQSVVLLLNKHPDIRAEFPAKARI